MIVKEFKKKLEELEKLKKIGARRRILEKKKEIDEFLYKISGEPDEKKIVSIFVKNTRSYNNLKLKLDSFKRIKKENLKKERERERYNQNYNNFRKSFSISKIIEQDYLNSQNIFEQKLSSFKNIKYEDDRKLKLEFEEKRREFYKNSLNQFEIELSTYKILNNNYLEFDNIVKKSLDDFMILEGNDKIIFEQKFVREKLEFVQKWIKENANIVLDSEQAEAVASIGKNYLVSARAGSGKTGVLISRAFFLIKHCGISPNEILLLAFNRKAVEDIEKRLKKLLGNKIPYIKTFHGLAYGIVKPEKKVLFDGEKESQKVQSKFFQEIIDEYLCDEKYIQIIKNIMLEGITTESKNISFEKEWNKIELGGYLLKKDDFLKYKKSIRLETIDGKRVKTEFHKSIANFLFEYNINYKYKSFQTINFEKRKIDFRIKIDGKKYKGIIIQFLGAENHTIQDFLKNQDSNDWLILYLDEFDFKKDKKFKNKILGTLKKLNFKPKKISEEEIWEKIKERTLDSFTAVTKGFIDTCRKQLISPVMLDKMILSYKTDNQVEIEFYKICKEIYIYILYK